MKCVGWIAIVLALGLGSALAQPPADAGENWISELTLASRALNDEISRLYKKFAQSSPTERDKIHDRMQYLRGQHLAVLLRERSTIQGLLLGQTTRRFLTDREYVTLELILQNNRDQVRLEVQNELPLREDLERAWTADLRLREVQWTADLQTTRNRIPVFKMLTGVLSCGAVACWITLSPESPVDVAATAGAMGTAVFTGWNLRGLYQRMRETYHPPSTEPLDVFRRGLADFWNEELPASFKEMTEWLRALKERFDAIPDPDPRKIACALYLEPAASGSGAN